MYDHESPRRVLRRGFGQARGMLLPGRYPKAQGSTRVVEAPLMCGARCTTALSPLAGAKLPPEVGCELFFFETAHDYSEDRHRFNALNQVYEMDNH